MTPRGSLFLLFRQHGAPVKAIVAQHLHRRRIHPLATQHHRHRRGTAQCSCGGDTAAARLQRHLLPRGEHGLMGRYRLLQSGHGGRPLPDGLPPGQRRQHLLQPPQV